MNAMRIGALVSLPACLALAGCETMSEDQCRKADWYAIGQRDGNDGQNERWLDAHRRACAKAGIAPDQQRWLQGWAVGVRSYCVPPRGWRAGLNGRSYDGACRDKGESLFLHHYEAGRAAYKTQQERDGVLRDINKAEDELKKASKDDDRKLLRDKLRRLNDDYRRLGRQLERQLAEEPR